MALISNQWLANLGRSDQVFLLNPVGMSKKCSPYLKLSEGKNLLVTMPPANLYESFCSNFTLPRVDQLAKKILHHGVETFVVIPNIDIEMRKWLHQMKVTQFSTFCDPENVISNALGITVSYDGGTMKYPQKLHILLRNEAVVYVGDTVKDREFQGLLKKVSEIFSENRIEEL
ncbi:MAG: hypothetical protein WA347_02250 [Rhabdochlamydiaceae bacterium]|jgi:peroxiredoxin